MESETTKTTNAIACRFDFSLTFSHTHSFSSIERIPQLYIYVTATANASNVYIKCIVYATVI